MRDEIRDLAMSLQANARTLRRRPTDVERRLWYLLRGRRLSGIKFRRQFPVGHYIVDFVCIEHCLVIEVDGGQHQEAAEADRVRDEFLRTKGFRVLRFWNNDVLLNTPAVLELIVAAVQGARALTPGPSPAGAGEGSSPAPPGVPSSSGSVFRS